MAVRKQSTVAWLLLTFTLPSKRASQRVEIWRKLQRYGTVPLGNSGYLLPNNPANEERFQWLATAIRKNRRVRFSHPSLPAHLETAILPPDFDLASTGRMRALYNFVRDHCNGWPKR